MRIKKREELILRIKKGTYNNCIIKIKDRDETAIVQTTETNHFKA